MVKVVSLTKKFGKSVILNDISVEMKDGNIIGLIGKNGAGKTTFFRCLLDICQVESGRVCNSSKHRKVIFDLSPKLRGFSVREYIKYFILLYSENNKEVGGVDVDYILDRVGLISSQNKKVAELSFGMRKMLYISTLLIGKTDFVVIDEPFNGLDAKSTRIVKSIIISLKKKYNATIIVSSHQHEQLKDICDCFLKIEDGKIEYIPLYNTNKILEIVVNTSDDLLEYCKERFTGEIKKNESVHMKEVVAKYILENPEKVTLKYKDKNAEECNNEFF